MYTKWLDKDVVDKQFLPFYNGTLGNEISRSFVALKPFRHFAISLLTPKKFIRVMSIDFFFLNPPLTYEKEKKEKHTDKDRKTGKKRWK